MNCYCNAILKTIRNEITGEKMCTITITNMNVAHNSFDVRRFDRNKCIQDKKHL